MKNIEITPAIETRASEIANEMISKGMNENVAKSIALKEARQEAYKASFVGSEKQVQYAISLIAAFQADVDRMKVFESKNKTDHFKYIETAKKLSVVQSTWDAATIIETLK